MIKCLSSYVTYDIIYNKSNADLKIVYKTMPPG